MFLEPPRKQKPRSNKRCFLNAVFKVVWSEGGQDTRGQKASKCFKTLMFWNIFLSLWRGASVESRGEESEKHRLQPLIKENHAKTPKKRPCPEPTCDWDIWSRARSLHWFDNFVQRVLSSE